jgi:hypothetical protein
LSLFERLLRWALAAGGSAGLVLTALHQGFAVPLILDAERLEAPGETAISTFSRLLGTALTDVLAGLGFALLLGAIWLWRGQALNVWRGLLWGVAAYCAVSLAPALSLPPELDVRPIGAGESLNGLLAAGEIDAIIGPRPPSCFTTQTAPVERLWPDYRAEEERYFDATGFFPLMHCMAVRKDVAAAHPWLPAALFRAYAEAKALALAELAMINVLRVSLPWIAAEAATQAARFGGDPWPYGFWRNREEIAAMLRFAREDGLVAAPLAPEDLFDPTTLELSC